MLGQLQYGLPFFEVMSHMGDMVEIWEPFLQANLISWGIEVSDKSWRLAGLEIIWDYRIIPEPRSDCAARSQIEYIVFIMSMDVGTRHLNYKLVVMSGAVEGVNSVTRIKYVSLSISTTSGLICAETNAHRFRG